MRRHFLRRLQPDLQLDIAHERQPGARARPSDGSLGSAWRANGFDDNAWLSGTLAVGYFNYGGTSSPT